MPEADSNAADTPGRSPEAGSGHGSGRVFVRIDAPGWWRGVRGVAVVARRAAGAARLACRARGPLSLLLADDATLLDLNTRHRGQAHATNVLSWPGVQGGGDIAIAFGVAAREARLAGRPLRDHLSHLVVHGALHCAGEDHEDSASARRMERREAAVLRRLGISDPYRSHAR